MIRAGQALDLSFTYIKDFDITEIKSHTDYKLIGFDASDSFWDGVVNNNIHVIYIRHENLSAGTRTLKPNTYGSELASDMKIVSKNVFTKYKGNALSCEEFTDFISKKVVKSLV